jgi:hypothetical protein
MTPSRIWQLTFVLLTTATLVSGCSGSSSAPAAQVTPTQTEPAAPSSSILTVVSEAELEQERIDLVSLKPRVAELKSLKRGSPEWTKGVEDIAALLRKQPDSADKTLVQLELRAQVAPEITRIAYRMLEEGTQEWGAELQRRLLDNGVDATVTVRQKKKEFTAVIEAEFMNQVVVHQFITVGRVFESAREAGIDKVVFENSISGKTWSNATPSSKKAVDAITDVYEMKWGLK